MNKVFNFYCNASTFVKKKIPLNKSISPPYRNYNIIMLLVYT